MLVASLVAFLSSNQFAALKLAFNFWDPFSITQYRLGRLSDEEYEAAIKQMLEEGDIDDAQMLVEIAREHGHEIPEELLERTQESYFEFGFRNAFDIYNGAITGEITNAASIVGVLASDYVGYGDLRDIWIQGNRLAKGYDYDKITLGFALVGASTTALIAGTSAATVTTSGGATPVTAPAIALATSVDTGASIIKTANKMRKLSKPLVKHLTKISGELVDVKPLKEVLAHISLPALKRPSLKVIQGSLGNIDWRKVATGDFSQLKKPLSEMMPINMGDVEKALKGTVRAEKLQDAEILVSSVSGVMSAGGAKSAFRALEHADDAKDLSRFRSLATRMGKKTAVAVKMFGRNAIRLGKLLYLVITILISVLGWVLGALWFLYSMARTTYRIAKRARGAA